ncbi:MAG: hypothetical protein Q4G03_09135, partial [Planctomycetia bacterium]|nr:hypothetical protein [Planctomycetia bacterium]
STAEDKLLQSDGTVRPRSGSIGNSVRDIPFELPPTWWDYDTYKNEFHGFTDGSVTEDPDAFKTNRIENYPLVKDELFGLGTVPGYKSAFLQRVADPNRPYHPLMNPYITVDWNMMDLTIFTGETMETTQSSIETDNNVAFSDNSDYDDAHDNNWLKLAENVPLGIEKDHTLSYNDAFSSRQWGNAQQKFFNRTPAAARPNPWARAFKKDGANAGLEKPEKFEDHNTVSASTLKIPAFQFTPNHTFGQFNGRGTRFGSWGVNASGEEEFVENTTGIYQNLNESYKGDVVYDGVPRTPYEHLVWNDAPYSNAFELLCVPSSAPGRFGLEFVRHSGSRQYDLSDLYDTTKKTALGSFGVFGFEEWYNDDNAKYNGSNDRKLDELKKKGGVVGPYLNFFASSTKPGETLNLGDLMGFVHVPSLYLGTKEVATDLNGNVIFDEYDDPVVHSKRREPGKVNLNSILPSVINSNLSADDFAASLEASPFAAVWAGIGTRPGWTESGSATYSDFEVSREYANDGSYVYFQPSHTHAASWIKADGSEPDAPSESSLLALNHEMNPDPLFGNIQDVYVTDGDGNLVYEQDADGNLIFEYEYTYIDEESGEELTGTTRDPAAIPAGATIVSQSNIPVRSGRHTNIYEATAEMQRLSGVTTDRSNVFAAWVTIGYFEVERCNPGVNMPDKDPDGNNLTVALLQDPTYKWYHYYREIYPDGYTYGRELGSEFGETKRHRGFSIIDRSIPVDFRRGNSVNYQNVILQKRMIE